MNSNELLLLDLDCKRMLRRKSKQKIIFEVIQKLEINKSEYIPKNILKNDFTYENSFYRYILKFFGCFQK